MNYKMIRILLLILISCSSYYGAKAQKQQPGTDTAKKEVSNQQLASKMDSILAYIKQDNDSNKEIAGTLCLMDSVPQYLYTTSNDKRTARQVVIDSATFLIKDGYIIEVRLYAGKRLFTNNMAPITLSSRGFQLTDKIFDRSPGEEYLKLQEVVSFNPFKGFAPDDGYITLTKNSRCKTLERNVSVNSVFDIRVYTDALGAFGKEPNGIFQTSARFKQFIHRRHSANGSLTSLQYFKLNLNYSKIDSKKSFVDSADVVSRLDLMQKSKVSGELALNVLYFWTEKKSLNNFYVDIGAGFNIVELAGLKDTASITTQYFFGEVGLNLKTSSNIGFDVYVRPTVQFSPQTAFKGGNKGYLIGTLGGEVFWNPFNSSVSRLFGRMNYTFGTKRIEKKNSFSQVQLGYSVLLSKLITSK